MSRWTADPEHAADELIRRALDTIDLGGHILLAYHTGALPALLDGRGLSHSAWHRELARSGTARPWPSRGPYDAALLRLPKAKEEQEMAAHACLSVLGDSGRLILYGGNDEGIRSAAGMIGQLCGRVETLATRGHGRVLAAPRPADAARVRGSLAEWRRVVRLQIGGRERDWVSYPGVFAADRIDEGTALLVDALPPLRAGQRVLDYGCGSGIIGAAAAANCAGLEIDLLDSDSVALEAARENMPDARLILGTAPDDAGVRGYHAILSNPPLHRGMVEDHSALERLIGEAPALLAPDGVLQIVVQRRIPLDRLLAKHFTAIAVVSQNGRYRVWRARHTHSRHGG